MEAEQLEIIRHFTEEWIPFNKLLGFKLREIEKGKAKIGFDFRPDLVGNSKLNILHGGVIASALDFIGGCAVMTTFLESGFLYGIGTVDMRVDYLHPGEGKHFIATGEVTREGRILSATRMELYNDDDTLVATGSAVYRVSRNKKFAFMNP